ncbi:MAG: hypothetical protein M1812_005530 [Candelaria pacifica]|nr:MAG: hypothetical protein M1812_005530 [Candelaria pacifica]
MASRAPSFIANSKFQPDLGAGLSLKAKQPEPPLDPLQHGEYSQASKALALGSYFLSGCMAINASQFLGAPLYLINEDWYNAWIAFTKQSWGLLTMSMTQSWAPTMVRVSGDKSVRGQLHQTLDGNLLCSFPERLVLIANHQIYTDWLYLWWIAYTGGMHGRLYIVLKESLKRIPVLGWGMQFSQFIFLKRNWEEDKPRLAAHLQKLNKPSDPMWLMMFPEGTNLAPSTRESSKKWADKNGYKDMRHQLLPRSTGLHFCLQELQKTVDYVYDCTIAYEGVPPGDYAQDIFTVRASYFGGRPPKSVNMFWRRFAVSSIPLDNPKEFDLWLRARWVEKDRLLEYYHRHNRFPADEGIERLGNGKTRRGAGFIETEIKPNYWFEFMQVFAPMGLFALVLYLFYGALPESFTKSIDKKTMLDLATSVGSNPATGPIPQASGNRMVDLQSPGTIHEMPAKLGPSRANAQSQRSSKKTARVVKAPPGQTQAHKKPLKAASTKKTSNNDKAPLHSQVSGAATKQQPHTNSKEAHGLQKASTKPKKLEVKSDRNMGPKKLEARSQSGQGSKKLQSNNPELKSVAKPAPRKLDVEHNKNSAAIRDSTKHGKDVTPREQGKSSIAASKSSKPPTKLEIRQ